MKYLIVITVALSLVGGFAWGLAYGASRQKVIKHVATAYTNLDKSGDSQSKTVSPTIKSNLALARYHVPILMYHYIRAYNDPADPVGTSLSVAPTTFVKQLNLLQTSGYTTISLAEFAAGQIPPKAVILTFDDGYDNHYFQAFSALKEAGLRGTFFIIGDFVNKPGYLAASQIHEMKSGGMEIGGHTMHHINLATASLERASREITASLDGNDPVFAYPSGQYNNQAKEILTSNNIKAAVTTVEGIATELCDPLLLPRVRVKEQTDILKTIAELGTKKLYCGQNSISDDLEGSQVGP